MDKGAIREELKKIRDDIKNIKSDFSKQKEEKELHFQKGEDLANQINILYEEIKKIESESNLDDINKSLDAKKVELIEFDDKLKELTEKFEGLKDNSKTDKKPVVKTISADKAKKEIKKLDLKLQTQVLSLEKEAELIKKIQEVKESLSKLEGNISNESDNEFRFVKAELRKIKKKYINTERKVRSLYKQIRLISKEKKKRYKQIDVFRDEKKKAFEEFRESKKKYSDLGKNLKDLFKKESDLVLSLGESPIHKKKNIDKELKQKRKEVEDKLMKKGGVLTTEDLLMFQRK